MAGARFLGKFIVTTMQTELELPEGVGAVIGDVAFIRRGNTYRIWECVVSKDKRENSAERFKFTMGWEDVVDGNNIQNGDSLYFDMQGNSVLTLFVFDSNNVSKEIDHLVGDKSRGRWKNVGGMHVLIMPGENSFAATAYLTRSNYEAFMVNIDSRIIEDGYLTIPFCFAKKNLIFEKSDDTIPVVLEVQGRQTTVALKYLKNGTELKACYINSTIRDFVLRNGGGHNGVFVFELESPLDPIVFKVTIFNI